MELLIVLGIIGGLFALGFLTIGVVEALVYVVASFKAFPVKTEEVYNHLVANNKELLEKIKARKEAKRVEKIKKLEEKKAKENETIVSEEITAEAKKIDEAVTEEKVTE